LALLCPLLFGAGPDYVGCGDGPSVPSTGTPLPEGTLDCEEDADCPADSCADVRCIAGSCIEVAPNLDADGDGDAPPPCGTDCDDTRPDVGGGFVEACDGLDNDCNMLVDDGASRIDRVYTFPQGDPTTVVAPWGDRFVFTDLSRAAIFGVPVSLGGETAVPFEILRLARGAGFTDLAASAASDGRVLFIAQVDTSVLRYVVLRPDGDGAEVVAGPGELEPGLDDIQAIDIIPFGSDWAMAFEGRRPTGVHRLVMTSLDGPPVIDVEVMSGSRSLAIATDGTHIVVPDTDDGVHFFLPTGIEVTGFTLPGISLARHPIASWRGAIVAVVADAFDYNIGFVDSVAGLGALEPAPFGASTDDVWIHTTTDLVYVTRRDAGLMRVQAIQGDLSTYDAEPFSLIDPGTGEAPESVSVAESPVAIGVAGGSMNGSSVAISRGCAP